MKKQFRTEIEGERNSRFLKQEDSRRIPELGTQKRVLICFHETHMAASKCIHIIFTTIRHSARQLENPVYNDGINNAEYILLGINGNLTIG